MFRGLLSSMSFSFSFRIRCVSGNFEWNFRKFYGLSDAKIYFWLSCVCPTTKKFAYNFSILNSFRVLRRGGKKIKFQRKVVVGWIFVRVNKQRFHSSTQPIYFRWLWSKNMFKNSLINENLEEPKKMRKKKSLRRRLNNFGEREFANFAQGQQSPSSLNTQSVLPTIRTNTSNAKYISFEGQ